MRFHLGFLTALTLLGACADDTANPPPEQGRGETSDASSVTRPTPSPVADAGGSPARDARAVDPPAARAPETSAPEDVKQGAPAAPSPEGAVTYYQHLKPVIDAKCARCHVAGTVAPFSLDSYERAKDFAKPSLRAVESGSMPPWKFDDGCNEYVGDYSLSDAEKRLFAEWVEQGALEGDAQKPAPAIDIGDPKFSRTDLTLTLPEPYTPTESPDEYRCFPIAWPRTETAFMTGFRPTPGNPKIVHHIEVYHVPAAEAARVTAMDAADEGPGYSCFSGPGAGTGTIGGWAPGSPGYDYPDGVGIQIDPGAILVVQVHYNTSAAPPAPDQSKVELKIDAQAARGGYNFWTNYRWSVARQMPIPAGNADVKHTWTADPTTLSGNKPLLLYTASIHMHSLGRTGYMKLKRKAGGEECLLRISDWDFHWQGGVRFTKPITIEPGDQIEMQCGFDNSAENQGLGPDDQPLAPRDVNWGEGTRDEMCLGLLLWGPEQ